MKPIDLGGFEPFVSSKVQKAVQDYNNYCNKLHGINSASALFSLKTLEDAQFLVLQGVKLNEWIELCHKSFTLFWGDAQKMSRLSESKEEESFAALRSWISEKQTVWIAKKQTAWRKAYYWPRVMLNFFWFCNELPAPEHITQVPSSNEQVLVLQSQVFEDKNLANIQFLQQRDIRLDLWIDLCCKAFLCLWPESAKDRENKTRFRKTRLSRDVKKKRVETIKSWCSKGGEFYPLNCTYLDLVLPSFLYDDNKGGRLRNASSEAILKK